MHRVLSWYCKILHSYKSQINNMLYYAIPKTLVCMQCFDKILFICKRRYLANLLKINCVVMLKVTK